MNRRYLSLALPFAAAVAMLVMSACGGSDSAGPSVEDQAAATSKKLDAATTPAAAKAAIDELTTLTGDAGSAEFAALAGTSTLTDLAALQAKVNSGEIAAPTATEFFTELLKEEEDDTTAPTTLITQLNADLLTAKTDTTLDGRASLLVVSKSVDGSLESGEAVKPVIGALIAGWYAGKTASISALSRSCQSTCVVNARVSLRTIAYYRVLAILNAVLYARTHDQAYLTAYQTYLNLYATGYVRVIKAFNSCLKDCHTQS